MQPFAERLSLLVFKFDEPMRDVIFVQEIIQLMSLARAALGQNAQPGKLPVAPDPATTHNQRIDDGPAHARQFGKRAPKFGCGYMEDFGFG